MGVCQTNNKNRRQIIRAEEKLNRDNLKGKYNYSNIVINHNNEIQIPNNPITIGDTLPKDKKLSHNQDNYGQTISNLSSNSTSARIYTHSSSINFTIQATIGETEIPIYVEKDDNIIIEINEDSPNFENTWSFIENEKPINYLGYHNYKYNNNNIGALFLRISSSQLIYHIDKNVYKFKANSNGSLLFFANLNPNDYFMYKPKGFLLIKIIGGSHIDEKEFNIPYEINNNLKNKNSNNHYILKEKKILKYINKVRKDISQFINEYFTINDYNEKDEDLKEFINKINIKRKELNFNQELSNLIQIHCEYICRNGTNGLIGVDGLNIEEKIKKNLNVSYSKVIIIYGIDNPLMIVKRMILDKYSKSKKNRNNLFFNGFSKIAICLREHIAYKYCCVISFSE